MKAIRAAVSGSRVRYTEGGFDLDLTYITPRLIAMGYPATGIEKTYRNDINEVASFLNARHGDAYRVYNLSERSYDYNKFDRRVSECGFPDHHPPPLQLLLDIINDMLAWTARNERNVVVVHCLAGKGRTGVVCSCFLLLTGFYGDVFAYTSDRERRAIAKFAINDFRDARGQGVRYPSQALYIYYFLRVVSRLGKMPLQIPPLPPARRMLLRAVVLSGIPEYDALPRGGCTPFLQVLPAPSQHVASELLFNSAWQNPKFETYEADAHGCIVFETNCIVQGDVLIRCFHANESSILGRHVVQMFHVTVHTNFIRKKCELYRLPKQEIDEAHDNPRFPRSFSLDCYVAPFDNDDHHIDDDEHSTTCMTDSSQQQPPTQVVPRRGSVNVLGGLDAAAMRQSVPNYVTRPQLGPRANTERAISQDPTVPMMGWLYKQGGFVRSWKKRWFVARDGQLSYFAKVADPTPLGVVDLRRARVDMCTANETTSKNRNLHFFKVVPQREPRIWFFGCESEQELVQWVRALAAQSCHGITDHSHLFMGGRSAAEGRALYRSSESSVSNASSRRYNGSFNSGLRHSEPHVSRGGPTGRPGQPLASINTLGHGSSARPQSALSNSSLFNPGSSTSSATATWGSFAQGGTVLGQRKRAVDADADADAWARRLGNTSLSSTDGEGDGDDDHFLAHASVASLSKSKPLTVTEIQGISDKDRQNLLQQASHDYGLMYIYSADELLEAARMQKHISTTPMDMSGLAEQLHHHLPDQGQDQGHVSQLTIRGFVRNALASRQLELAEQVVTEIVMLQFPMLVDAMESDPTSFMEMIAGSDIDLPRRASVTQVAF